MKKISTILFCILQLSTFSQTWEWAQSTYGSDSESATCSDVDAAGNLYVSGTFGNTEITFGSFILTKIGNSYNSFLVKYAPDGNIVWAKNFGTGSVESISSITHDGLGNIYIAGAFDAPTVTFGPYTLTEDTLYGVNMFLVKFASSGSVLWAIQAGGNSVEYINSAATDYAGNTYITGGFHSPTITLGNTTLQNSGWTNNIFTAKVNSAGNILWAKGIGSYQNTSSSSFVRSYSNALAPNGDNYILGHFSDSLIIIENDTIENSGNTISLFMVKYDSNGNKLMAKRITEGNGYRQHKLSCDLDGNLYMAGSFTSPTITFGTYILQGPSTTQYSKMDLVKYDPNGNVLWAKTSDGNSENNSIAAIKTDNQGNVFVAGNYGGLSIILGDDTVRNFSSELEYLFEPFDPPAHGKFFVAGYDPSGTPLFARGSGAEEHDISSSVTPDNNGNVYLTGQFTSDSIIFGSTTLINSEITYYNQFDLYIAKLNLGMVGISEQASDTHISIYPNPSLGLITILYSGTEKASGKVYDLVGKIIIEDLKIEQAKTSIDLQNFQKGIYLIEISTAESKQICKLIIH